MQISSSISGLYPVPVSAGRKPVPAHDANKAGSATTAATELVTHQHSGNTKRIVYPTLDAPAQQDAEALNAGGLSRQFSLLSKENAVVNAVENTLESSARDSIRGFRQGSVQGLIERAALHPAQRAVAAYVDVATQEHRQELVELLGIDVFA